MKTFFTFYLLFTTIASSVLAQTTSAYQADLKALHNTLQQTPSYKDQIKGEALKSYLKLYDSLSRLESDKFSPIDYFSALSHLFFPIRDNHLGFYEVYDYSVFTDTASYRTFRKELETKPYPTTNLSIDSLVRVMLVKSPDDVEGIYHYEKYYSFALFKTAPNVFEGVIIDSQVSFWKKGQMIARLYEYAPNCFRAIYTNPLTKKFDFYPNDKFRNQSLINSYFYLSFSRSNYRKNAEGVDFVNLIKPASDFQFKRIREDVQYLQLGNFSASTKEMVVSDAFYESIKDSLTSKHLIVDLRGNTGGAEKVSKKFLASIKKHARTAHIHVLVNNGTISQGEIFLLQLSTVKNVTTYGQTTQGKIAYGSNYGNRVMLPSGKFEVYITDMKDKKGLVKYENAGVTPQVIFDNSTDWIERVVSIIDSGN